MRILLASLALCCLFAGCSRTPPEEALRGTIDTMHKAVEAREMGPLSEGIAPDFIGPGGMDRQAARRLAQVVFLQNRDIGMTMGPLDVALREGGATVRFTVAMTGGSGGMLPTSGQVYDVRTDWRQDGDEWKLVAAEWDEKL